MIRLKKINSFVLTQYILEEGNRLIDKWLYWLDIDQFEVSLLIDENKENYNKYLARIKPNYDEWKATIYLIPPDFMQEIMVNEHLYTVPFPELIIHELLHLIFDFILIDEEGFDYYAEYFFRIIIESESKEFFEKSFERAKESKEHLEEEIDKLAKILSDSIK